jgi:hypothetical protein
MEIAMSHNKYSNDPDRAAGRQSQDALRHREDALHNKRHKSPLPGVKDVNENDAGQQPEIPKVGSRDAPGG